MIKKGKARGFPEWLSWFLSKPDRVASAIIQALEKDKTEIICTANGRLIASTHKSFQSLQQGPRKWVLLLGLKIGCWGGINTKLDQTDPRRTRSAHPGDDPSG